MRHNMYTTLYVSILLRKVARAAKNRVITPLACSACMMAPLISLLVNAKDDGEVKGAILSAKNSQHSS